MERAGATGGGPQSASGFKSQQQNYSPGQNNSSMVSQDSKTKESKQQMVQRMLAERQANKQIRQSVANDDRLTEAMSVASRKTAPQQDAQMENSQFHGNRQPQQMHQNAANLSQPVDQEEEMFNPESLYNEDAIDHMSIARQQIHDEMSAMSMMGRPYEIDESRFN